MKKILFVSLWILFTVGLVLVMSFASKSHAKRVCTKLTISIDRKNADLFIKDEDVLKFLSNHGKNPVGLEFAKINTALLEKLVLSHPSVESCEVYISALGDINIAIQQRSSVSRIINLSNESFYFRNMSLKYDNDFIHFTKKTNYMNSNIEKKNQCQKIKRNF